MAARRKYLAVRPQRDFHKVVLNQFSVAVFSTCSFNNAGTGTPPLPATVLNPNLRDVTLHETGHAFDYAIGKSQGPAFGPSTSKAFKKMVAVRGLAVIKLTSGPLEAL